jgi:hypothetical protein
MDLIAIGITWLSAGPWLSGIADRIFTVSLPTPAIDKVAYDGDFHFGDLSLTVGTLNNDPYKLTVCTTASKTVALKSGGRTFILGPRTNPIDPSGRPEIAFVPEHGDSVTLTARRSFVGWPTPFEFNWMVRTPSWRRYVYYHLTWKKRSGAELTMRWRYEQEYYRGTGWTVPLMEWNWHTGLLSTEIRK